MKPTLSVHLDNQHSFSQAEERLCDFYLSDAVRATIEAEGGVPVEVDVSDSGSWYFRFTLENRITRKVTLKAWGSAGEYTEESTTCELYLEENHLYPGLVVPPGEFLVGIFDFYSTGRVVKR